MNLKGKYDMVRAALLLVLDVPADTLDALTDRGRELSTPSITSNTEATKLLALNTLVVTHQEPKKK